MSEQLQQLKSIFHEIFQLDQADLDFGIYRIMRQKRDEVDAYLEGQLLNDLRLTAAREYEESAEAIQRQIIEAKDQAFKLGYDVDNVPRVKQLENLLHEISLKDSLEDGVLSDLVQFLGRYYKDGDFLSLPRYRKNSYAIEYNGEEVKLHWANADQYYVKTAERFRDYRFRLPDGKAIHFKITAANTETGNNKSEAGKERRFQLLDADFMREENGELLIFFRYAADEQKRKQADINAETVKRILEEGKNFIEWRKALSNPAPTENNKSRTLLEKHLNDYTARNTFDYFIHKDLEGFLRRELDFYIKNEIVMLDDIENEDAPRVELYLAKVKALRRIGHKLIAFLAQVENFCKKLFLKKKFVVRANYCVTLDRVPRDLWTDILANDAQIQEWRELYAIDEIKGNLINGNGKLNAEFLEANQNLVVDTRHFSEDWKLKLLASFENLDAETNGLLIKADNFHALNFLQSKYRESVQCTYIDPPYNKVGDGFIYKDGYQHSSWLSMMNERVFLGHNLLRQEGVLFSSIDANERNNLEQVLKDNFGENNRIEELIWSQNTTHNQSPTYSTNHEYIEVFAKDRSLAESNELMFREPKDGYAEIMELVEEINPEYPSIKIIEEKIKDLMAQHLSEFKEELEAIGLSFDSETKKLDSWKGIYNYKHAEYRDTEGNFVSEELAKEQAAKIWVWREDNPSMPSGKQSETTKNKADLNYRFYKPLHPITGKEVNYPKRGWVFPLKNSDSESSRNSFEKLDKDKRIVWGSDEKKIPQTKKFLHETETNVAKSVFHDYTDGEKEVTNLFGEVGTFPNPKPTTLIRKFVVQTCGKDDTILDYFAGSGTTAHSIINLNRDDFGKRKYILVETNEYFDSVTLRRVKKAIYTKDWRDGKPVNRRGDSHVLKYFALESYEDAMNNLALNKSEELEQAGLQFTNEFREDYLLNYMLEFETNGSQSLLNLDNLSAPFDYKMKIAVNGVGETQEIPVDIVETFNYLIGLYVEKTQQIDGFRVVRGTTRTGERCLILWRTTKDLKQELADKRLNDFLEKQNFDFSEIDTLYINGDAAIPVGSVRTENAAWQIKMIEADFLKRMFE